MLVLKIKINKMKILKEQKEQDLLFIDIETVRVVEILQKDSPLYDSWEYKMRYSREAEEKFGDKSLEDLYAEKAALYAEFGKIVCITIGKVNKGLLTVKSYKGDDEKELLTTFMRVLGKMTDQNKSLKLVGHAIKGFDIPFIMRRSIINGIDLHPYFDSAHLKPWEMGFVLDTLELWKGTGFYSAALINIAVAMGIPSPKSDMNGSETSQVYYYEEDGLDRIAKYCEQDVICVAKVVNRLAGSNAELDVTVVEDIKVENPPLLQKIFNTQKITEDESNTIKEISKDFNGEEQKIAKDIMAATIIKKRNTK